MAKLSVFSRAFLAATLVGSLLTPNHRYAFAQSAPTDNQQTASAAEMRPAKIVILYSTIGMGHLSAARAIEADVKQKNPTAVVVMKNIRDFMPTKHHEYWDEKLFWKVVKGYPDFFDKQFRKSMDTGNRVQSLDNLPKSYNEQGLLGFLTIQNPTAIIATHYGSAVALGNLKDKGHLKNIPVGWLHTDYFTGFFPRISQRIEKTFVGMSQLKDAWEAAGVRPNTVTTTGMPINPGLFEPTDRVEFLTSKGLDPKIKTIVLASGGEGVGDFPLIVDRLAKDVGGPLQIVAVCAKNEKHFTDLTAMKDRLPRDVNLTVHKMIPNVELLNYIKSSDLYITKSGGLSPTEGFAIARPMILLDVYGGHERDNAALFEKEGLAVINRDQAAIGVDAKNLLANEPLKASMHQKQIGFRNSFNLDAISDFALDGRESLSKPAYRLGVENGSSVVGAIDALDKLQKDSPAQVEIILSYGKSSDGGYLTKNGNPFGHLAVRIGDQVYTANGNAVKGIETSQILTTNLADYLYGIKRPTTNIELTDAYGSAYGRDNISVRVAGISQTSLDAMHHEVQVIEAEWAEGKILWDAKKFNCADFVARILRAGGFDPAEAVKMGAESIVKGKHITMPVDVFDAFRIYFENKTTTSTEIVGYSQVAGSENVYRTTRFPLSIHRIAGSVMQAYKKSITSLEMRIGKRLSVYNQDPTVKYENVNGESAAERAKASQENEAKRAREYADLKSMETRLDQFRANREKNQETAKDMQKQLEIVAAQFTEAEIQALLEGKPELIARADKRQAAQQFMTKLKAWDAQQKKFLNASDWTNQAELDFIIKGLQTVIEDSMTRVRISGSPEQLKALQTHYNNAKLQYEDYLKHRHMYGQPKDGPTRTVASRLFFDHAKAYLDQLNAFEKTNPIPAMKGFWASLKERSSKLFGIVRSISRLTPKALTVALNIYFRPVTGPGKAPVVASINSMFRTITQELGFKVNISNKAGLPVPGPIRNKTIKIVSPTHRDPFLDTMVMSHLGLDNVLLVMATDQIVPLKALADKMANVDSIITVGRGSDQPINMIMERLAAGKTDTILIYPEGSVSAGLAETRPLREKFSYGLLKSLRESGYKVELTPVIYKTNVRTLHESSFGSLLEMIEVEGQKTLEVKVAKTIQPKALRLLEAAGDNGQLVNRFIRSLWMESLSSEGKFLNGALRTEEAVRQVQTKLGVTLPGTATQPGGAMSCHAIFGL